MHGSRVWRSISRMILRKAINFIIRAFVALSWTAQFTAGW